MKKYFFDVFVKLAINQGGLDPLPRILCFTTILSIFRSVWPIFLSMDFVEIVSQTATAFATNKLLYVHCVDFGATETVRLSDFLWAAITAKNTLNWNEQSKQKWFSDGLPNEIIGFEMELSKAKRFNQKWNGLDCF